MASKWMLVTAAAAAMAGEAMGMPVVLSDKNFETEVFNSGKSAFIKFYAPWCGHCKAMKPAWDDLGKHYLASSSVLIGDVDCTSENELCSKYGVSGYPTIKYFPTGDKEGKPYNGGRSLDDLKKFAEDNLEVKCDVKDPKGCTDKEKKFIDSMQAKSAEDRSKELTRLNGMAAGSMKPELKQWLFQRINILKQLA
uniref:Thioredoxin domain-containing protein n=1 Tax=Hanusia phi TaxID=3032 RepID=A0A7S0HA67_9CRYP|mmetsp:Transcript_12968/g.29821  ORF Transcript_12968/g.29821 Transcript_12968/m.29821 type:complete len:195 (+) Transcript_12968:1-585(+)